MPDTQTIRSQPTLLARCREVHGSVEAAAAMSGLGYQQIMRWSGGRGEPRDSQAAALAKCLRWSRAKLSEALATARASRQSRSA